MLKRINTLIKEIGRNPFNATGKPEPRKHALSGYWSRRLNEQRRIVYKIQLSALLIAQLRYHYWAKRIPPKAPNNLNQMSSKLFSRKLFSRKLFSRELFSRELFSRKLGPASVVFIDNSNCTCFEHKQNLLFGDSHILKCQMNHHTHYQQQQISL